MSVWQPWPPRILASAYILGDGTQPAGFPGFGVASISRLSTGVYQVTFKFGLTLTMQTRAPTVVIARGGTTGTGNAFPRYPSSIWATSGDPWVVQYDFRDTGGVFVDCSHIITQFQS